jgi:hypothetical protein
MPSPPSRPCWVPPPPPPKIGNLLAYPDFEQAFALFEPVKTLRVRLVVEGRSREECALLLGGLSLPLLQGGAAEDALAAQAADQLRQRAASKRG